MKLHHLKHIIKEEIHKVLNESKQVGLLYHFTYLNYIPKIFEQGIRFFPDNTKLPKYKNMFYISTTRDHSGRKFVKDSEYVVRITLDGDKISNHYLIEPINHNYVWAKDLGIDQNWKSAKDYYYEERIWSLKEEYLNPKYIIKIDTIIPKSEIEWQIEWGKEDSKRRVPFDDSIFKYVDDGKLNFVKDFNNK
jgi:hypothetical protein